MFDFDREVDLGSGYCLRYLAIKRGSPRQQKPNTSCAQYVVLDERSDAGTLASVIRSWNLDEHLLLFLFQYDHLSWDAVVENIETAVDKASRCDLDVAIIIVSPFNCDIPDIIPSYFIHAHQCVRVFCTDALIDEITGNLNVDFIGHRSSNHRHTGFQFSRYIITRFSVSNLVKLVSQLSNRRLALVVLGSNPQQQTIQPEAIRKCISLFPDKLFLCPRISIDLPPEVCEMVPLVSLQPETLFLWLTERFGDTGTKMIALTSEGAAIDAYGSLVSVYIKRDHNPGHLMTCLKRYCVCNALPLPDAVFSGMPHYDQIICIQYKGESCDLFDFIHHMCVASNRKILFLLFLPDLPAMSTKSCIAVCNHLADIEAFANRCIVFTPFGQGRAAGLIPHPGHIQPFPLKSLSSMVDMYVLCDMNSVSGDAFALDVSSQINVTGARPVFLRIDTTRRNLQVRRHSSPKLTKCIIEGVPSGLSLNTAFACHDQLDIYDFGTFLKCIEGTDMSSFDLNDLQKAYDKLIDKANCGSLLRNAELCQLWVNCISAVLIHVIKPPNNEKLLQKVVTAYLKYPDPFSGRACTNPLKCQRSSNVFLIATKTFLRGGYDDILSQLIVVYPKTPLLGLCPILGHLGRLSDVRYILQGTDDLYELIPNCLYTVGVFIREIAHPCTDAFQRAGDMDELRSIAHDLGFLTGAMIKDAYEKAGTDIDRLLFDRPLDFLLPHSVFELASMAECSSIATEPLWQSALDRRWKRKGEEAGVFKYCLSLTRLTLRGENVARVTYGCNLLSFIAFLIFYSYMIIPGLQRRCVTWREIGVFLYMSVYFCEEVHQLVNTRAPNKHVKWFVKVQRYWSVYWNKADIVCIGIYTLALLIRIYVFVASRRNTVSDYTVHFYSHENACAMALNPAKIVSNFSSQRNVVDFSSQSSAAGAEEKEKIMANSSETDDIAVQRNQSDIAAQRNQSDIAAQRNQSDIAAQRNQSDIADQRNQSETFDNHTMPGIDSSDQSLECMLALAHVLMCINVIFLSIRFLQFAAAFRGVGPLICAMGFMCMDLDRFLCLLLIALVAYGVALLSILKAHSTPTTDWSLVSLPYLHALGDMKVEDLLSAPNKTDKHLPDPTLSYTHMVALPLAALYVLFTNLLLANLLIAMFNESYKKVKDAAEVYYMLLAVDFLEEYESKSFIPIPFVVVKYLWWVICCLLRKVGINRCCQRADTENERPTLKGFLQKALRKLKKGKRSNKINPEWCAKCGI